ncbi:MAG TPA: molybdate ABC transporter substrate-binding protein [Solirubrobacteraceae bacterium]|jgi:molybdate transport system substrate-binding protein
MHRYGARLLLATALLATGCGEDRGQSATSTRQDAASTERPTLTVSAATSLKRAFETYGERFGQAKARFSFAGSDELAAQIRQGLTPDVFASANTTLPDELNKAGLVEQPRTFAGNRLVLAVPKDADTPIERLDDLAKPGTTIAIGAETVPVGAYTRKVLDRLPRAQRAAILKNVRSEEPDVGGVVGKLTQGAVDAGFVYTTDVAAAGAGLREIRLPDALQPDVAYGVAVVKGAKEPEAARAFVEGLIAGAGQTALRDAGFLPPPAGG